MGAAIGVAGGVAIGVATGTAVGVAGGISGAASGVVAMAVAVGWVGEGLGGIGVLGGEGRGGYCSLLGYRCNK